MGIGRTLYLSLSVSVCLCICLFVSLRLGHCHHQIVSFQKIYGMYCLEHHTVEINGKRWEGEGDVTMNFAIGIFTVKVEMADDRDKCRNSRLFFMFVKHFHGSQY